MPDESGPEEQTGPRKLARIRSPGGMSPSVSTQDPVAHDLGA